MKLTTPTIVKKFAMLSLAVAGITGTTQAFGDEYVNVPVATANAYQPRTLNDLQTLTAPIALYPDALLTQVLVASTYPTDVIAASQYLQNGGDPTQAASFGWDDSVQGLLQTPQVLNQLAGNVDWMNQLGDSFLNQQQDVFAAVQNLRAKAQSCGNLVTTPQEQVVVTDNAIQILPADPQVIYVPVYNPEVVYVTRPVNIYDPCITFSTGIRVGFWLNDDYDWHDRRVYSGNWGGDRPWWHADRADYVHSRPGVYVNNVTNVNIRNTTNIRNTNVNVWNHDNRKAAPAHVRGPVVSHVTNVTTTRTNVNVRRTETPVNHTQASTVVRTNKSVSVGRTIAPRTEATVTHKSVEVSKKTVSVNHNQPVRTAQPNPVHQPAARQIPTHAPQSVATTSQRTTSKTVTRNTSSQVARNNQTVSRGSSVAARPTTVSRSNDNSRSNGRHG